MYAQRKITDNENDEKKMNPRMKYDKHLIVVITSHLVQSCYYEAINYVNNATALEEGTIFQHFISFSLFLPGSHSRNRGGKYLISSLNFATFFFSTLSSTSFFFFSSRVFLISCYHIH